MEDSKRVFLTGATGFLGSHVLEALLNSGYQVRALVRDRPDRLPERAGLTVISGDLVNCGDLVPSLRDCQYLIHLASVYPSKMNSLLQAVNVDGCAALLEAAYIAGIEKAVVTSSALTLRAKTVPIEPPCSSYVNSKILQERISTASPLPCVLVLPTTVIGPGSLPPHPSGELLIDLLHPRRQIPSLGEINLVPVEDVANGHLRALERGWPGERYLLSGESYHLEELEILLAKLSHRKLPRVRFPGRRPSVIESFPSDLDSSKAAQDLGWWPGPVDQTLEKTIEWYRTQGLI